MQQGSHASPDLWLSAEKNQRSAEFKHTFCEVEFRRKKESAEMGSVFFVPGMVFFLPAGSFFPDWFFLSPWCFSVPVGVSGAQEFVFFCPWNRFECYWNRLFGSPWCFRCPEGFFLCPTEMKCPRVFLVPVSFGNIDFVAWFNEKRFTKQRYGRCWIKAIVATRRPVATASEFGLEVEAE